MKKIGLLLAAALLCGGLAGCGNNNQSKNSNKDSAKISSLKAENSSLKAKKHSSHKKHKRQRSSSSDESQNNASVGSKAKATNGNQTATSSSTQHSNANSVVRDKDGRVINPDGTRGPIPSPYKEGTPEYDQWLARTNESIRVANNEPALQLGPEPRADNGQ